MTGKYIPLAGARVICGACKKETAFIGLKGGGDTEARAAGWIVYHGPQPYVRCPLCAECESVGPLNAYPKSREAK